MYNTKVETTYFPTRQKKFASYLGGCHLHLFKFIHLFINHSEHAGRLPQQKKTTDLTDEMINIDWPFAKEAFNSYMDRILPSLY